MLGLHPPRDIIEIEPGENGSDGRHHEEEGHKQNQESAYACEGLGPGPGNDHQIGQQHLNANQNGNEKRQRHADGPEQDGAEIP